MMIIIETRDTSNSTTKEILLEFTDENMETDQMSLLTADIIINLKGDRNVYIGRTSAPNNSELVTMLNESKIASWTEVFNYNKSKIDIIKKLLSPFLPAYKQPWVFFELNKISSLYDILHKFWICSGGSWRFLITGNAFNREGWNVARETTAIPEWSKDIESIMQTEYCSITVIEDYLVKTIVNKQEYTYVINSIRSTLEDKDILYKIA